MGSFITSHLRRLLKLDKSGATSIEYALIAGGVSIAIVTAVTSIGSTMNQLYYDKLLNMF